jgi:AcrR family transcriptional regulator
VAYRRGDIGLGRAGREGARPTLAIVSPTHVVPRRPSEPRDRLLRTAADLFYREGIHGVGVDRVLAEANVTRATMYRHFPGKEALVTAYLELEDATIRGLVAGVTAAGTRAEQVAALVEAIAEDAVRRHTRGCPFVNASAEFPDPDSPVRVVVRRHRDWFRAALSELTGDPAVAAQLVLLRDAMLVGAYLDGDDVAGTFRTTAHAITGG